MRQLRNLQERKPTQLELPFGYPPRTAEHDGKRVVRRPTATTLRPANDDDCFAERPSGTYPTRGVFNGHDVRQQPAKFRGSLTLLDFAKRVGPADEYPEGYRR